MPSTTNFAIPYPSASDTVDVPRDIQAVADRAEIVLDPLRYQYSHRNAIINGDFSINQRGFTSTTADQTYGFDRWLVTRSDGTTTYSAQAFTPGNQISGQEPTNFARLATTGQTAAGAFSILAQRIEGVRTFAGQQVTLSFWAKANSGTPKVAVEFQQVFGTGGSPSTAVNTYAGQITLSTSWARYTVTTNIPSISGKTLGTSDDHLGLVLWVSAGSTWNSRTGSLGIQTNTFDFWGVQLEAGAYATPFERRPQQIELALCQRYFYNAPTGIVLTMPLIAVGADNVNFANFFFPVQFRATPNVSGSGWSAEGHHTAAPTIGWTSRNSVSFEYNGTTERSPGIRLNIGTLTAEKEL